MPRIEVEPAQLDDAGGRRAALEPTVLHPRLGRDVDGRLPDPYGGFPEVIAVLRRSLEAAVERPR